MDFKLTSFTGKNANLTKKERKLHHISQSLRLEGPISNDEELTKNFLEVMDEILKYYIMDNECIYKLKDEICTCEHKLTKKDIFEKEFTLPGGSSIFLKFYRYYCSHCKKPGKQHLTKFFEENKHYSKNVKSDAIRLYSKHLSSYELVAEELSKIYKKNIDKKTVRIWLKEAGLLAEDISLSDKDWSGHIVYDEEFCKVFDGLVGIKGAKLKWIQVYVLLFRDAITQKCILRVVDSLSEESLLKEWEDVILNLQKLGIKIESFGTDGKREYKNYIRTINKRNNLNIQHVYDAFHFIKGLYEKTNDELFGSKYSKKNKISKEILAQIKEIEKFFYRKNKKEALSYLSKLIKGKIKMPLTLGKEIDKLKNNFDDYTYFFNIPEMKTTNLCENWFGRTKPKKIKKEYKTIEGLKYIINMVMARINYDWQMEMNYEFDFSKTLDFLLGTLKVKTRAKCYGLP